MHLNSQKLGAKFENWHKPSNNTQIKCSLGRINRYSDKSAYLETQRTTVGIAVRNVLCVWPDVCLPDLCWPQYLSLRSLFLQSLFISLFLSLFLSPCRLSLWPDDLDLSRKRRLHSAPAARLFILLGPPMYSPSSPLGHVYDIRCNTC